MDNEIEQVEEAMRRGDGLREIARAVYGDSSHDSRRRLRAARASVLARAIEQTGDVASVADAYRVTASTIRSLRTDYPDLERAYASAIERADARDCGPSLVRECVIYLVSLGHTLASACVTMCRSRQLGAEWQRRHPDFAARLERARSGDYDGPLAGWHP